MEKLKLETPDITQQNIDRIAELFPSAITETKDEDGKLKRAINFTVLKQLLSDEIQSLYFLSIMLSSLNTEGFVISIPIKYSVEHSLSLISSI